MSDLGEQIKRLRVARGFSQAALAQKAKLSLVYIVKLEGGARQSPSFPALARIARTLGATLTIRLVPKTKKRPVV